MMQSSSERGSENAFIISKLIVYRSTIYVYSKPLALVDYLLNVLCYVPEPLIGQRNLSVKHA